VGQFSTPILGQFSTPIDKQQELAAYPDLRGELLRRTIEDAANGPYPRFSAAEVFSAIAVKLAAPRPAAAVWDAAVSRPRSGGHAGWGQNDPASA